MAHARASQPAQPAVQALLLTVLAASMTLATCQAPPKTQAPHAHPRHECDAASELQRCGGLRTPSAQEVCRLGVGQRYGPAAAVPADMAAAEPSYGGGRGGYGGDDGYRPHAGGLVDPGQCHAGDGSYGKWDHLPQATASLKFSCSSNGTALAIALTDRACSYISFSGNVGPASDADRRPGLWSFSYDTYQYYSYPKEGDSFKITKGDANNVQEFTIRGLWGAPSLGYPDYYFYPTMRGALNQDVCFYMPITSRVPPLPAFCEVHNTATGRFFSGNLVVEGPFFNYFETPRSIGQFVNQGSYYEGGFPWRHRPFTFKCVNMR